MAVVGVPLPHFMCIHTTTGNTLQTLFFPDTPYGTGAYASGFVTQGGRELPRRVLLGNSEALGHRKGPRSNNLGPLLYIPRRARTINSAGLLCNARRGESSDYRQLLFASPPSSRTDRGILTQ